MNRLTTSVYALILFTMPLIVALSVFDLMSFFEQALILWVCLPIGMGSIVAYFMDKTDSKRSRLRKGVMSHQWTLENFK